MAARLDRDLFMKTYWYNFLLSCPRFMSNLFIFISEMRRCGAELTIFVICLRLSGAPAPAAAGICRFAAETKTVLCSNMTSLRGLSDIRPDGGHLMGTDLERLEIHNSQGGFTIGLWSMKMCPKSHPWIHFLKVGKIHLLVNQIITETKAPSFWYFEKQGYIFYLTHQPG